MELFPDQLSGLLSSINKSMDIYNSKAYKPIPLCQLIVHSKPKNPVQIHKLLNKSVKASAYYSELQSLLHIKDPQNLQTDPADTSVH